MKMPVRIAADLCECCGRVYTRYTCSRAVACKTVNVTVLVRAPQAPSPQCTCECALVFIHGVEDEHDGRSESRGLVGREAVTLE